MITTNAQAGSPRKMREKQIVLAHGGGGQLTDELLEAVVLPRLGNETLNELLDSGIMTLSAAEARQGMRLAMSIDSYVVQPLKFPGGDIGRLAISGTVNDLAVVGAEAKGIALALILEEGLERRTLEEVMDSIAQTAAEAGVQVVTGDTKVIQRRSGSTTEGIYITTAGVGVAGRRLGPEQARAGDVLILNGPIAEHGVAVMLAREMPEAKSAVVSDAAPLNRMLKELMNEVEGVHFMRDPTRGGLAGAAAELAARSGLQVVLEEEAIPLTAQTRHAAEMLGLDPLEVANEGKVLAAVRPEQAEAALAVMRRHERGRQAAVIGKITAAEAGSDGMCEIRTRIGGRRIVQKPYGEQLPRIC